MRHCVTLLFFCFLAVSAFCQQPLIEKIEVSVVNVDVTVTDRAGKRVRGLTVDDFEIFEDSKPQKITNFYAVQHARLPAAPRQDAADDRFRRKVLVIVDNVHSSRHNRDVALARLEEFINDRFQGGQYEWSFAVIDRHVHLVLPLTSDKEAIHNAVVEIRRAGSRGQVPQPNAMETGVSCGMLRIAGQERIFETEFEAADTTANILDAARSFATTGGKKLILLLTGGLGLNGDFNPSDVSVCAGPSAIPSLGRLAQKLQSLRDLLIAEANASNVSFYIVNTEGLQEGPPDAAMYWMARETGGRLLAGNFPSLSLQQFDFASSNFYALGYRPSNPEDGRYHRIRVRVKDARGYALQYRGGYSSMPNVAQLARALKSTMGVAMMPPSAIPLTVTFGEPQHSKSTVLVPVNTAVPAQRLQFLQQQDGLAGRVDIFISIFDDEGKNLTNVRLARAASIPKGESLIGDIVDTTRLRLVKGKLYRIVVAVRDQLSDAVGVRQQVVRF
jgi:VWFA-related protein